MNKIIRLSVTQDKKVAPSHSMRYCVDDPEEPGSPLVGYGRSIGEALGNWMIGNSDKHNVRLKRVDGTTDPGVQIEVKEKP